MVTDTLSNAYLYRGLSPRLSRAIAYVQNTNLAALSTGRHNVEGDAIFALVQRYQTKPISEGRYEAHRQHIDLQVVVEGRERIGYGHLSRFVADPYDEAKDILWLDGEGTLLEIAAGSFMIMMPEDVHMPGIAVDEPSAVTKVVVKIAI